MKRLLKALEDLERKIEECRSSNVFEILTSEEEEIKILQKYEQSFNSINLIILRLW